MRNPFGRSEPQPKEQGGVSYLYVTDEAGERTGEVIEASWYEMADGYTWIRPWPLEGEHPQAVYPPVQGRGK